MAKQPLKYWKTSSVLQASLFTSFCIIRIYALRVMLFNSLRQGGTNPVPCLLLLVTKVLPNHAKNLLQHLYCRCDQSFCPFIKYTPTTPTCRPTLDQVRATACHLRPTLNQVRATPWQNTLKYWKKSSLVARLEVYCQVIRPKSHEELYVNVSLS